MSELALLVQRLTSIDQQLQELSARQLPATAQQVQVILETARNGITVQTNPERLAQLLAPSLLGQMPSNEAVATATQRGVKAIEVAGQQAAAGIEQAAARVPRSIRVDTEVLGFTGFKSFGIFSGLLLLVLLFAGFGWRGRGEVEAQVEQLQQQVAAQAKAEKEYQEIFEWTLRKEQRFRKDYPKLAGKYFPLVK